MVKVVAKCFSSVYAVLYVLASELLLSMLSQRVVRKPTSGNTSAVISTRTVSIRYSTWENNSKSACWSFK